MPHTAIQEYLSRLEARQAETSLLLADTNLLAYMSKGDRSMTLKRWIRQAKARTSNALRPASAAVLKLMGIGVEVSDE